MSNDYGAELHNVLSDVPIAFRSLASDPTSFGPSVSPTFRSFRRPPSGFVSDVPANASQVLYFPPGRYVLNRSPDSIEEIFTIPKGVELFFASDAILRIGPGVTLVIEGTIRAGRQQIFGFNRFEITPDRANLRSGVSFLFPGDTITWPIGVVREPNGLEVPCGRIEIAGDEVALVRPEWWGARVWDTTSESQAPNTPPAGHDSSEAFLGAIDAACTGRAARRRSPIPIALTGLYQIVHTLEVHAPVAADGAYLPACLVWHGDVGTFGFVSVTRNELAEASTPRLVSEVLLRLHPGVDFELRDVSLVALNHVDGIIEVICDGFEPAGRRGSLRRVTLTALNAEFLMRIVEEGNSRRQRSFVLDSCALIQFKDFPCRSNIRLDVGDGTMLRISNSLMGAPTLPDPVAPATVTELTPNAIYYATCHLSGGSALLDSLQFHQALGPRPSREPPDFDQPDGQDVFLGAPAVPERAATQLTMMQCESQGWWLLGRDARAARAHQAVLVGVNHNEVAWFIKGNQQRRAAWGGVSLDSLRNVGGEGFIPAALPPSVVWRGRVDPADPQRMAQCVLIGTRLGVSMVIDDANAVANVASVFLNVNVGDSRRLFVNSAQVGRRSNAYAPIPNPAPSDSFDESVRHVVPILEDGRRLP